MGVLRQSRSQGLWIALTACGLLFGGFRAHNLLGDNLNFAQESTSVSDVSVELLPTGSTVVFGLVPEQFGPGIPTATQNYYAHLYQWYLPDTTFRVTSIGDYPENGWVFAPTRDPILVDRGATLVWHDPGVDIGLWRTTVGP